MFGLIVLSLVTAQTPAQERDATVVVTARSLDSTERALAACLDRSCSPAEHIAASLAHGENLFIAGDYAEARRVLGKSRDRNIRHSKILPTEVSDLTRAYGRIAAFDGHADTARLAQIESLEVLKSAFGGDDARVLAQRMMLAEEYIKAGRLTASREVYSSIEKRAAAAKLPAVLGHVMLRQAVVYSALASIRYEYRSAARFYVKRLEASTDPALAAYREGAKLLRAKLAALDGDETALDTAIAALDPTRYARPTLVYSPGIDLPSRPENSEVPSVARGEERPEWIDVAFEIGLDGRVTDIDILRKTDTVFGGWPDRVRKSLAGRRYAPIGPGVDRSLLHRTERFSMVYNLAQLNGSRIMSRSPQGQIISLDLTDEPASASATPSMLISANQVP